MSFLEQCLTALRWKKLILVITVSFALVSVVVALVLPKWYLSTASLFPPEEESFSLSALSSLVSATTLGGGGGRASLPIWATPSDVYAAVLHSRTVAVEVIRRHDLLQVYQAPDTDRAVRTFDHRVTIKVGGEGVVQIKVLDRDPRRAAAMANDLVELLDRVNREKQNTSARQARIFLQGRLTENRHDMAAAEQALRAIQESTGVMIPEDQLKAVIEATAEVQVQLMLKEVDLSVLEQQVGPSHPDREALAREVEGLRRRMKELDSGSENTASIRPSRGNARGNRGGGGNGIANGIANGEAGLDLPLRKYPGVQLAYLRALREVTVQETIYQFLNEEYERYRIQESRDTPTVQVLDAAVPATYKARPVRWLICACGTLAGFLLGLLLASAFESLRRLRAQSPEQFERVRLLARELRLDGELDRL